MKSAKKSVNHFNQNHKMQKPFFNSFNNSTFGRLQFCLLRLTLEMSALLSPHNGNLRLVLIPNVSVLLPLTSLSRQARNMDNKGHEVFPKLYSLKRQKQ